MLWYVSMICLLQEILLDLLTGALGLITTLGVIGCPILFGVVGPLGLAGPLGGALLLWYGCGMYGPCMMAGDGSGCGPIGPRFGVSPP